MNRKNKKRQNTLVQVTDNNNNLLATMSKDTLEELVSSLTTQEELYTKSEVETLLEQERKRTLEEVKKIFMDRDKTRRYLETELSKLKSN